MKEIVKNFHRELLPTSNVIESLEQVIEWNKLNWSLDLHQRFWKNIHIVNLNDKTIFEWCGTRDNNGYPVFDIDDQTTCLVKVILYKQYYYTNNNNQHILQDIVNNTDPLQLVPFRVQHEYLEKITKLIIYWKQKRWVNIKKTDIIWINRLDWPIYRSSIFFNNINIPENYMDNFWIWTAGKTGSGYGAFIDDNGKTVTSHRLMYQSIFGNIVSSKMWVRHIGDMCRPDINPFHLIPGTTQDNMNDRIKKSSRIPFEKNYGFHKLNNKQVYEIIKKLYYNNFFTLSELSKEYNVVDSTIGHITANRHHQKIMNKFVNDIGITKEIVLSTISKNIKNRNLEFKSFKCKGSKAYQSKLTEREVIKYRFRKYFFNLRNQIIYKTITNHNNISKYAFASAINGNSWKSLNDYIDATKEMKTLNYSTSSTVDDLIIFMKNNPKYQETFYLDQY